MGILLINDGGVRTASAQMDSAKSTLKRASEQIKTIKAPDNFNRKAEFSSIAYAVDTNANFAGQISSEIQSARDRINKAEKANEEVAKSLGKKNTGSTQVDKNKGENGSGGDKRVDEEVAGKVIYGYATPPRVTDLNEIGISENGEINSNPVIRDSNTGDTNTIINNSGKIQDDLNDEHEKIESNKVLIVKGTEQYELIKEKLINKYNLTEEEVEILMEYFETEGIPNSYISAVSEIVELNKYVPEQFESKYGYPLYTKNGKDEVIINDTEILLDIFVNTNKSENGERLFIESDKKIKLNIELINKENFVLPEYNHDSITLDKKKD